MGSYKGSEANPLMRKRFGELDVEKSISIEIPVIITPRLRLDAPREGDYAGYASIVTGERGVGIGGPLEDEEAWLDFAQMAAGWIWRGYGALSIRLQGSDDYLGTVLVHHEFGDPEPELGWLLTAEAEGRGIAFEAGQALLHWVWQYTDLKTVVSYMDPNNSRALALAKRLGGIETPGPEGVTTYRYFKENRV